MRVIQLIFIFSFSSIYLFAQDTQDSVSTAGVVFGPTIGFSSNFPAGDLADRFGRSNEISVGIEYQMTPSNWAFSSEIDFYFGNNVKEDVIAPLRLDNGFILGENGAYANVFLRKRGVHFGLMAEKILMANKNGRGIRLGAGLGLMNHFIRIQDDTRSVPQLRDRYRKGYDRNTRGFAIKERLAYNFVSESRRINLSVGLEFTQGFTKNVRAINFDTGLSDPVRRLDLIYALKLKWVLPLVNTSVNEEIFY